MIRFLAVLIAVLLTASLGVSGATAQMRTDPTTPMGRTPVLKNIFRRDIYCAAKTVAMDQAKEIEHKNYEINAASKA